MRLTINFQGNQMLTSELAKVTDGTGMFKNSKGFDGGEDDPMVFTSLTNGTSMFEESSCVCNHIYISMPKIENATRMFYGSHIQEITLNGSSVFGSGPLIATEMFKGSDIENVCGISFHNVTDATSMFENTCKLTSFGVQNANSFTNTTSMFANSAVSSVSLSALQKNEHADYMFQNCINLSRMSFFNDGPTTSKYSVCGLFEGCCSLTEVGMYFSDISITSEGQCAAWEMFYECANLKTFYNPSESTCVYYTTKMFKDLKHFSTFTSGPIKNIVDASEMFSGCTGLRTVQAVGSSIFQNGPLTATRMFYKCSSLPQIAEQFSTTKYANYMFYNCSSLKSFTGFDNLENGCHTFEGCSNLTSATIKSSVFTSGPLMFYGCSSMKTCAVNSPKLTKAKSMFYNCRALESFSFFGSSQENKYLHEADCMFSFCSSLKYVDALSIANAEAVCEIIESLPTYPIYYKESSDSHIIKINPTSKKEELIVMAIEKGWHVATNPDPYYYYDYDENGTSGSSSGTS